MRSIAWSFWPSDARWGSSPGSSPAPYGARGAHRTLKNAGQTYSREVEVKSGTDFLQIAAMRAMGGVLLVVGGVVIWQSYTGSFEDFVRQQRTIQQKVKEAIE